LQCLGLQAEIADGVEAARESLRSGKALAAFQKMLAS
jgi:anthranilate phosphoribosyltransferase